MPGRKQKTEPVVASGNADTDTREPGAGPAHVCLGVVLGGHGVHGRVKIRPFTQDPADVGAYGPVETSRGVFVITAVRAGKGGVIARLEGVTRRVQAEALKGAELFVPRFRLGENVEEDSFFHADLLGLAVEDRQGTALGQVVGVHDFGAGDLLEIRPPDGDSAMLPFSRENVPQICPGDGRLVVDLPDGFFGPASGEKKRRRSPRAKEEAGSSSSRQRARQRSRGRQFRDEGAQGD